MSCCRPVSAAFARQEAEGLKTGRSTICNSARCQADQRRPTGFDVIAKPLGKGQWSWRPGRFSIRAKLESAAARQQGLSDALQVGRRNYTLPEGVPPSACGFGTLALAALADRSRCCPPMRIGTSLGSNSRPRRAFRRSIEPRPMRRRPPGEPSTAPSPRPSSTRRRQRRSAVPAGMALSQQLQSAINYGADVRMGCHYATLWPDAKAVIARGGREFPDAPRSGPSRSARRFTTARCPIGCSIALPRRPRIARHIGVVFHIANGDSTAGKARTAAASPLHARLGLRAKPRPALPRSRTRNAADRLQASADARRRHQQPHRRSLAAASDRRTSRSPTATQAASSRPTARP